MRTIGIAVVLAVAVAGCAPSTPRTGTPIAGGRVASAILMTPAGRPAGRATIREVAGGLRVTIDARGLPPGLHGAHLHTIGQCLPPDFASAGGHWNPMGMKHGSMNPQGPHAGDLPNLMVGADGRGTLAINLAGASFDSLIDADGAAMVIHADPDDLMTDPSGNSGRRIVCGVLKAL